VIRIKCNENVSWKFKGMSTGNQVESTHPIADFHIMCQIKGIKLVPFSYAAIEEFDMNSLI
jgi:hypothetical protein